MRPATLLLLLGLALVAPQAAAQFIDRPGIIIDPVPVPGGPGGGYVDLRVETRDGTFAPFVNPWLVAGFDNVLNLTVHNFQEDWTNATFAVNVTGASSSATELLVSVPPFSSNSTLLVVHPDDTGMVEIEVEATDAFAPGGEPLAAQLRLPALLLPSMRFLDPPVIEVATDGEFVDVDPFRGGSKDGYNAYLRLRPGESVRPRIELTNPFEAPLAGFSLQLTGSPSVIPAVDVPALDPGASFVAEFEEFTPVESFPGGYPFGGPMGSFELRPQADLTLGGAPVSASPTTFRLDRGAVVDVTTVRAWIDVQSGVAVDLRVPRAPVLGAPTRILYNLTNLDTAPAEGALVITVSTPSGLFYEVQGPEAHQVPVSLGPGQRASGSIDVTPRVTGQWFVETTYRAGQGFGMGGGGGFEVRGPVELHFDRFDQVFARIGEPVEVGVSVLTTDTLQDAQLRLTAGSQFFRDPFSASGGDYRPGFADTLIRSSSPTSSLGTLRPEGDVNTTIEVSARSSGYYNVVPYVLSEGFAYTSTVTSDFTRPPAMLSLVVMARAVPAGLSLAPLTIALAFFVGAWTLRTRFVK